MLQKRNPLAAKQANAFNFIEGFPEKFETDCRRRRLKTLEVKDSVSQCESATQNPSILILDEATSSLTVKGKISSGSCKEKNK
jgi:ABC-type transport system involved in Fe-S cluster assembly fused permease/ATPase subunit